MRLGPMVLGPSFTLFSLFQAAASWLRRTVAFKSAHRFLSMRTLMSEKILVLRRQTFKNYEAIGHDVCSLYPMAPG